MLNTMEANNVFLNGAIVAGLVDLDGSFEKNYDKTFLKVVSDPFFVEESTLFIYSGKDVSCVEDAAAKGATVICNKITASNVSGLDSVYFTKTEQPFKKIISYIRKSSSAKFCSVTGSVGKSTVKEMLGHALKNYGPSITNKGNRNGGNGIVEALGRISKKTEYVVLEVASAAPGSILQRNKLVNPDVAIITSVGEAHLQNYESKNELLHEKFSLLDNLRADGVGIISRKIIDEYPEALDLLKLKKVKYIVVGGEQDDIYFKDLVKHDASLEYCVVCYGHQYKIKLNSIASHDALNTLFVFAACHVLGVEMNKLPLVLSSFKGVGRRLERYEVKLADGREFAVVDDSFNSSPTAVLGAIEAVSHIKNYNKKIFVFGDMLELSDEAESEHVKVAKVIKNNDFDILVTVGEISKSMSICEDEDFEVFNLADCDQAVDFIVERSSSNDLMLVKGSHATGLHNFVTKLKKCSSIDFVKKS